MSNPGESTFGELPAGSVETMDQYLVPGPTGPTGPVGPIGPIGYTGYTGWTGPAGSGDMVLDSPQTNSALKTFLDSTFGLRNVANTFTSFFTNTNTASRTYTLQDRNGTLAFDDIADLYKYSIVRTVASNNLTVALKNYQGNDPTSSVPVKYQDANGVVRSITSALSVIANAGTNYLNLGSAELATREVDLFTLLQYDTVASATKLLISRFPVATTMADLTNSNTGEKGAIGIANYTSTDSVVNIGRFNAILSAGAGYTWSIPATSVIVNSPKNLSRNSLVAPQFSGSGGSAGTFAYTLRQANYTVRESKVSIQYSLNITNLGSWSGIVRLSLPFTAKVLSSSYAMVNGLCTPQGVNPYTSSKGLPVFQSADTSKIFFFGGSTFETVYLAWSGLAVGDTIYINTEYEI